MQEPRPAIEWRDLTGHTWVSSLTELLIPLPWLLLSWLLYATPAWMFGPLSSFMFFLCALRLNHEAIHSNLGLPRWADRSVLHVLSALMAGSNHVEAYCHLQHHRTPMGEDDHEGLCGRMTLWQVLRYGPVFPIRLNIAAWRNASPRWKRRFVADYASIGLWGVIVFGLLGQFFPMIHFVVMILAQCLAAFFAVWITHQGCEEKGVVARSQRGPLAWLAYHMFYHREHHLFPAVPVRNLPALARRLDERVPGYADGHLPIVGFLEPDKRHRQVRSAV